MTLPTDYVDGDVLTAADVNAITLAVNSNTNGKLAIGTFNAKGDLLVGLTNDSVGVLTVGTNGYLLSASSGATGGLAWVAAGGKVLGFAYDEDTTNRTTTSITAVDITGLSVNYTPISASSNLVVDLFVPANAERTSGTPAVRKGTITLTDGTSASSVTFGQDFAIGAGTADILTFYAGVFIRRIYPSTGTSQRTFKGQFSAATTDILVTKTGTAVITVTEIAA